MFVVKADGTKQEFSSGKIINTCVRSGLSRIEAEKIAKKIKSLFHEGMTTHEIFSLIQHEIESRTEKKSYYIRLRYAIANLDPVSFELYVQEILDANGYKTSWNRLIKGKYVEHQVDVMAEKDDLRFLVECKHHFNSHRFTGLGTCLQVQARMEDINAVRHTFNASWIFTNNKFSEHAKKYSKGIGIRLTGWRYERKFSIESMAHKSAVLPVTVLDITEQEAKKLLDSKIITIQDVIEKGKAINLRAFREASGIIKL